MKASTLLPLFLLAWCASAAPLPVILDTDMDSDVDDVAALAECHALADRGEIKLLAVMVSGHNEWSSPCIEAIDTFYRRPDLPIGLNLGKRGIHQNSLYTREVAEAFPQDFTTKPKVDASALYRKLLAASADRSVVIIGVGDLTNLAALLASKPDQYSPLDGRALVAAKVARYVCMGGRYPADTDRGTGKWGNFRTDPESTSEVNSGWPGMLIYTGGGAFADSMAIGKKITALNPKVWPISLAYRSYFKKSGSGPLRHTADPIAVFVAVRGTEPWFKVARGTNHFDSVGRNSWTAEPEMPNRLFVSQLNRPADAKIVAALLEDWVTTPPKASATSSETP